MNAGVYEHVRHPGHYYLLLGLAREHDTDVEKVVYVPLRVEVEWQGTARMALRPVVDFEATFRYVGDRLPACDHDWEEGYMQRRCKICWTTEAT